MYSGSPLTGSSFSNIVIAILEQCCCAVNPCNLLLMVNRRFAVSLISALADLGVEHAVISPGSRNTPLIAGFAAEARIRKWSIIDERSAGFFAIGLARVTGRPVALASTSGTAAVEYHPAVVEASQSDISLIVLTADRPPELRDVGAPQTIDQLSLYGAAVRMFADALTPDGDTPIGVPGDIAIDAWAHATAAPPGPVHVNLPFREPLLEPDTPFSVRHIEIPPQPEPERMDLAGLASRLDGRRGLIVAGRSNDPQFPAACAALGTKMRFPIVADPLSGLRYGPHLFDGVLAHGDLLAAAGTLDDLPPEVVVRFGPIPTSKSVWSWLADNPHVDQILVDMQSRDATHSAGSTLETNETATALALAEAVSTPAGDDWLDSWLRRDETAAAHVAGSLQRAAFPNEPAVAQVVIDAAPDGSVLTIGSSMPIRDVDAYAGRGTKSIRLFGNRGANGIDGTVSAALGTAASGRNAVVLLGDVSMFHDLNSLGTAVQLDLPITIVVVNNDGGGIFHFLPQRDPEILDPETFENYLATPHQTDFVDIAKAFGIDSHDVEDVDTLRDLIADPSGAVRLIQIRTDRRANHRLHRRIADELGDLLR
jgi:2-succinyl-5-enolpyruvyl-6-hydroxy-3-cyclohexene-1-carboxylate synthase